MSASLTGRGPAGSNTGSIFASQTLGSILRAVYAAVLARKLGPELFGLMNYGLGWYAAFLAVANLQLESYMSRAIALDPSRAPEILSKAMTLRIFSTLLVFAIAAACALTAGEDTLLVTVLLICAVAMVGRSAAMWCNSAFISREQAGHVFRMEVVFRSVEVLAGIAVLLLGFGLIEIVLIHALSWWAQSIYGFWQVRTHLSSVVRFQSRFSEQIALFRTVLPVAVASIGATWLMQGPFVMFKDKAAVESDLGVVALVLQIFVLVTGLPVALGRAALPALSRTVARADNKEALFLGLVLRAAIGGTAALIIGAASAGPTLVPLIFGEAYRSSGVHLAWGMMLILPFGVATIANQILIAHDSTRPAMISAALGATAMTFFVYVVMPAGGSVTDYFLCVFAGMAIWSAFALGALSRSVEVRWFKSLVKPALVGGLSVTLYGILAGAIGPWSSGAVSMLALLAGQWVFNIVEQQERATLSRYVFTRSGRR